MAHADMGRRGPDDGLLTLDEAAKHLGVPLKMVKRLIRRRQLDKVRFRKTDLVYLSDVNTAAQAIADGVNVVTANQNALRALAETQRLRRRLTDLIFALGVRRTVEALTPDSVKETFIKARDSLHLDFTQCMPFEILEWSRLFYSLDEGFYHMASSVMRTNEPWMVFIQLGHAIYSARARAIGIESTAAFDFFDAALRSARCAAYLYCRGTAGAAIANRTFPDSKDANVSLSLLALIEDAERTESALIDGA